MIREREREREWKGEREGGREEEERLCGGMEGRGLWEAASPKSVHLAPQRYDCRYDCRAA